MLAEKVSDWYAATRTIGLVIFLLIETPVLLLILGSFLGKPRRPVAPAILFVGILIGLFILLIVGAWLLGIVLSFIVPIWG